MVLVHMLTEKNTEEQFALHTPTHTEKMTNKYVCI